MTSFFPKLRILIDPLLKPKYGPEICWAWRLLLTSIGYSWEEVHSEGADAHIAYVCDPEKNKRNRFCVRANPNLWEQTSRSQLLDVMSSDGVIYPVFDRGDCQRLSLDSNGGQITCNRDIIFDLFWLITGQEERHWPKDKHGFFDLSDTIFHEKQVQRSAPASSIAIWLERNLLNLGFPSPVPRWPIKKQAAVCLSHDVDYPQVIRAIEPLRIIRRLGKGGLRPALSVVSGRKTHWHFDSWVQLEKRFDVRSAFYFSAAKGSLIKYGFGIPDPFYDIGSDLFKQTMVKLVNQGFEIGLHASYLAFKNQEKFADEKRILEQNSGQEILGNRHHYWHLDPADIESTLLLHEQIGLRYDASLAHEHHIGWRRGVSWPFFPFHQKERRELKVLQLQTTWMDDHLFGYLRFNSNNRLETLQQLIDTTAEQGGCLVVDIHDYVFDDSLFPGWKGTYVWLLENLIKRSDFWIATPGDISEHWSQRYSQLLQASQGLKEGL